jgi:hypothetical protein
MSIAERIAQLPLKEQRGSRVRCLLLTDGDRKEVANRLSVLAAPYAVIDADLHDWFPKGLKDPAEAKLESFSPENRKALTDWWLAIVERANTPNWDIASTCTIEGKKGLLLVEAKAHVSELKNEGKSPDGNVQNHRRICDALKMASDALNQILPGWALSADSCYQLANRFAWAWKIASLGIPVILIYLGFLSASDMSGEGKLFVEAREWQQLVIEHSRKIVPEAAWANVLLVGGTPMQTLIRSMRIDIPSQ